MIGKNYSFRPSEYTKEGDGERDEEEVKNIGRGSQGMFLHQTVLGDDSDSLLKRTVQELSAYKYALDESAVVFITDGTGKITHVNKNFCIISQYSRDELIGSDQGIVNYSWHAPAFVRNLWLTIAGGNIWKGEIRNRAKDGSFYWIDTTIIPFLDESGKPYQYVATASDITAKRVTDERIRSLNERFTLITKTINDALFEWNFFTGEMWWSESHYTMFGFDPSQPIPTQEKWLEKIHPDDRETFTKSIEDIRDTGESYWQNEIRYLRQDGTYGTLLSRAFIIFDEEHRAQKMLGSYIDITDRKNEELEKTILSNISLIFNKGGDLTAMLNEVLTLLITFADFQLAEAWLIGSDQKVISLKAQCRPSSEISLPGRDEQKMHFEKGEGLPGLTWERQNFQHWSCLDEHPDFIRKPLAVHGGLKSAYGVPLFHNHQIIGVLVLGLSTEQKPENIFSSVLKSLGSHIGAEVKRKQLEEELNQIFNSAPDIICIVGFDRYLKKINPAMCRLMEYSDQELLSKPIDALIHPDDLAESVIRMQGFQDGMQTMYFENRYLTKSGKIKWFAWTATRSSEEGFMFCVAKDISEKKHLEHLLEKTNKLALIGGWEVDVANRTVYWSKITRSIHEAEDGFNPDFDSATSFFKAGIDRDTLLQRFIDCMGSGISMDEELRLITFKGKEKWVRVIGEAEMVNGACQRIYGSFQDIDQQKRNSIELEESEQRYSNLFHLSPQPMWVFDKETLCFLDVNDSAIRHYGFSREEFLSMTIRDIRLEADIPVLKEAINMARNGGYTSYHHTFRHRTKRGEIIIVDIQSTPILYKDKPAKVVLATDVTERFQYIAEIENQNKKLREISWLQSHVVRAPVARLMAFVDLMKNFENSESEREEMLKGILNSARELDNIIKEISEKAKV
ncbi:PAS domain-containing protein [Dyadobacter luticola]|uniref:histidine kinase n=1 Tax=Dyadobacter luticola TaxID=1979387 RepID=A0A5R9KPZ1_9BACT|nr:PAS domain-containing protein [Dyadobacter luticola]TLU98219.1 PAS domain S-box protein [Dyadobacter luticola]